MNIRAKCSNEKCSTFDIEKSVTVGQMLGYGAPNDRVACPICGGLMTTTQTINTSAKGRTSKGRSKSIRMVSSRSSGSSKGHSPKRLRKRMRKRG
jgi:hypothetical protein